jgi:hypothetical protein
LVLLSGCLKGPTYTYEYSMSDPYNVSGVVEMRVNATARVLINNSGGGEMRFKVDKAALTANYEGGGSETVAGFGEGGTVPKEGSYELELTFTGVPVKYALLDNPPRFHPKISSYDVNVTVTGQQLILFIWSPQQESRKDMRIPLRDMPVGEYLASMKDSMTLEGA